jgi:catechol 2,3-dioxygenase-like lactoylglutathione lyase family enzyme
MEEEPMQLSDHHAYATIPASDLIRAKGWYRDKLGLSPTSEDPLGLFYRLGDGTAFMLYPTPNAGQAPNTLMAFSSDDVMGDVRELRSKGVVFEEYDMPGLKTVDGIAEMGPYHAAWFKDSEGNILGIGDEPH